MSRMRRRVVRSTMVAALIFGVSCEEACNTVDDIGEFVDSISDGAPCATNAQCLGQRCLSPQQGYPNGYCTTFQCQEEGCSGLTSECFATEVDGQPVTACYELCNFDGTCDRGDEGYICVTLQDTAVCLPPDATSALPQGATGSSCSADLQCNGDGAVCMTDFFGGYCSRLDCSSSDDCLEGNPCVAFEFEGATQSACMRSCSDDSDCRFKYSCQERDGQKICLEGEGSSNVNPDGEDDGEPCVSQINCKGGTCIREAENEDTGEVSFPGGYCTTKNCDDDDDCNGDSLCVPRSRSTACLATCAANDDCRDGYECVDTVQGKACDSIVEQVTPEPDSENSFEVTCQSEESISFTVPEGSVGFYIAPFTRDQKKVSLGTLTKPDNSTLDIATDYGFMAINSEILGSLAPIQFPGSDRPEFRNAFGGGDYTLDVSTTSSEVCWYMIPQAEAGDTLHINLYLVGVPGLDASSASDHDDLGDVIDIVETIYGKMRITASVQNYFGVEESVEQQYSTIRDFNDVYNLVATSTPPGSTQSDALSVNVFLINDFNISEAPGLLGVSTGIPGVAGLHGNSGAGLVFSTASLGEDNVQLGQTMAHEIGHFVGLRHTTEHYGSAHDPITDTPECLVPDLASLCPDSDNFMFAFALGSGQQTVTTGQAFVVRRNPLVK